jgi:hypothetical protein
MRKKTAAVLCSMTLLAAPAASTCGPAKIYPCDVGAVVKNKCATCHSNPPINGAPMSLATWDDSQKPSFMDPTGATPFWQRMQVRINANTMPPTVGSPVPPALTTAEKTTMSNWFGGGAKAAPDGTTCP